MRPSTVQAGNVAFKSRRGQQWTAERVERLTTDEVRQLRSNAQTLGEEDVVALCDEVLKLRPKSGNKRTGAPRLPKRTRDLVSRNDAFQARGVYLPEADSSWSGVRKSDGKVVMTLWASAIVSSGGRCSHLLWAPNVDGSRPWSDSRGGKQRLEHCKLALEQGGAEGLLVHGEALAGHVTEDHARTVYGVDPELVVHFQVERRGDEYWAVWGAKAPTRAL